MKTNTKILLAVSSAFAIGAVPVSAKEVARTSVDMVGNDIVTEAVKDPKISGITCHVTHFDRGTLSRLGSLMDGKSPFEDPSNSSIACRQTAPIEIGDIKDDEDIFSARTALIFKKIAVKRSYDCENDTLIYLTHAREISEGSAKHSVSTVPLYRSEAVWKNGKPVCNKK